MREPFRIVLSHHISYKPLLYSFFSHSNVFVSTLSSLSQSWPKLSAIKTILCSQFPSFHHPRNPGLNPPTSTQQRQCGLWASLLQHCSTAALQLLLWWPPSFLPLQSPPAQPGPASCKELHAGPWIIPACSSPRTTAALQQPCSTNTLVAAPQSEHWAMGTTWSSPPHMVLNIPHQHSAPPPPPPAVPRSAAPSDVQMIK